MDGVTKVWDLDTGLEKYEFIQITKSDWLIKSPEGFFDGTPEAFKMVHFVKGMKSYSLDQFFNLFYKPEAISNLLTFGVVNNKRDINNMMAKLTPPEVKIVAIANESGTEAEVFIKVSGDKVDGIQLKHNGKRLDVEKGKHENSYQRA